MACHRTHRILFLIHLTSADILILLIIECAIMPRMGWLWIITAALDLVLLAMCCGVCPGQFWLVKRDE